MSKKIPHPTGHVEWLVADQKPLREWWRWHFAGQLMHAEVECAAGTFTEFAEFAVQAADALISVLTKEEES